MSENSDLTPEQLRERAESADERKLAYVEKVRITLNEQIVKWTEYKKVASAQFNLKAFAHARNMIRQCTIVLTEDLVRDPEKTARQFIEIINSPEADAHRQKMAKQATKQQAKS